MLQKIDKNGRVWITRPEAQPYVPEEHSEQELIEVGVIFIKEPAFTELPDLSYVAYSDAVKTENGKVAGWSGNIAFWAKNATQIYVPFGYDESEAMFRDCLYHIAKGDYDEWKNTVEYILASREQAEEAYETLKCIGPSASVFVAPKLELH